ncbi:probable 2-oxoglutarate dehydrogenase E1 component DHKTD1, mitochondrial, partial [Paramuricea clavata]
MLNLKYCRKAVSRGVFYRGYKAKTNRFGYKDATVLTDDVTPEVDKESSSDKYNVVQLVSKYRDYGHKKAFIDPLKQLPQFSEELDNDISLHNIAENMEQINLSGVLNVSSQETASLSEIIECLEKTYCGHLSVELNHISNEQEKLWIARKVEESTQFSFSAEEKKHFATLLMKAKTFDDFLAKKFPTFKRYCGAGAESALPFVEELFSQASA